MGMDLSSILINNFSKLVNFLPTDGKINTTLLNTLIVATDYIPKRKIFHDRQKLNNFLKLVEYYLSKLRWE
jgi:hypothetical protein